MKLAGKSAIVTGSTRGIGLAVAREYLRQGARVTICGRDENALSEIRGRISDERQAVLVVRADVTSPQEIDRLVGAAIAQWGGVDILVNNAGVAPPRVAICGTSLEDWTRTLVTNLTGPFLATRAVLPHMLKRGGGSIINVSSRLARGLMDHGRGAYAVTKWGLEAFTQYLAEELRDDGIRVNSVAPGLVATALTGFKGRSPESIVDVFVHLASDEAAGVSGKALYAPEWRTELGLG